MSVQFTMAERAVLRLVQGDMPDSATPYADIASMVNMEGVDEAFVLALVRRLVEEGAIRRFGASIKHQKTGWTHNAMVAWKVDEILADTAGEQAALHARISHCYLRPSSAPDWPYTLYTMVHGRSQKECLDVVEELRHTTILDEYAVLESVQELKKTSMTYF